MKLRLLISWLLHQKCTLDHVGALSVITSVLTSRRGRQKKGVRGDGTRKQGHREALLLLAPNMDKLDHQPRNAGGFSADTQPSSSLKPSPMAWVFTNESYPPWLLQWGWQNDSVLILLFLLHLSEGHPSTKDSTIHPCLSVSRSLACLLLSTNFKWTLGFSLLCHIL